jgi:cytochrome c oxidase cbb3-type subunit 3
VYADAARESQLQPGGAQTQPHPANPYEGNAFAISEGQRLFSWYNCTGCHANGGGAIGPPLIKDVWIYGNDPANLFDTIVKGRPNGMPAWGGRIPEYQVWQLVAWVRSMNKLEPQSATPQRIDTIEQDSGTILNHPQKVNP